MKMKTCGCRYCRAAMHRSTQCKKHIRSSRKGARRKAKMDLKAGKEPEKEFAVGYMA